MRVFVSILGLIAFMIAIQSCGNSKSSADKNPNMHTVVVEEVLQAGEYTYLRVTEDEEERWLAAPAVTAAVGGTYYYKGGTEMKNFKSKELSRTFKSVYFIDFISSEPITETTTTVTDTSAINAMTQHIAKTTTDKIDVKIVPVAGGTTIAELYKNRTSYDGKTIKVKGKVTKFSSAIMDKNWIHIQDGTEYDGNFDLTVTSLAEVAAGDTITVEGKLSLDKDFGFNYVYKVLLEDAVVK
ncbi:MAG: GW dipeptide domain-containing protein [Bacteroidota bacterium]